MKKTEAQGPGARSETVRGAIRRVLAEAPATARDLSTRVGVREKDIAEHLEHLERSLRTEGLVLHIEPANCLACGFVFKERRRLTRPSACPQCRQTRIEPPVFEIRSSNG